MFVLCYESRLELILGFLFSFGAFMFPLLARSPLYMRCFNENAFELCGLFIIHRVIRAARAAIEEGMGC